MLQFIVSIIAFVISGLIALVCGVTAISQIFIAGLLGVILINLLLCTSIINDLQKEVAELKSMLKEKENNTEDK